MQQSIARIELMPNLPEPFHMRDRKDVAVRLDGRLFDFDAREEFMPFIRWDESRVNYDERMFGLPSYVGDRRHTGDQHEAITCLGAVLGASLAGVDKRRQDGGNFVRMCRQYFNRANGENVVLNFVNWQSAAWCSTARIASRRSAIRRAPAF